MVVFQSFFAHYLPHGCGDASGEREYMKILIADDHDLLTDTLVMFLDNEGNIETVTAGDLDSALKEVDGATTHFD